MTYEELPVYTFLGETVKAFHWVWEPQTLDVLNDLTKSKQQRIPKVDSMYHLDWVIFFSDDTYKVVNNQTFLAGLPIPPPLS